MKVKIMDYETAKAEVLAREQNPHIANERHVYGVDKAWAGWGQVRDIYKDLDGFYDVEDGYIFSLIITAFIITRWQTAKLLILNPLVWC